MLKHLCLSAISPSLRIFLTICFVCFAYFYSLCSLSCLVHIYLVFLPSVLISGLCLNFCSISWFWMYIFQLFVVLLSFPWFLEFVLYGEIIVSFIFFKCVENLVTIFISSMTPFSVKCFSITVKFCCSLPLFCIIKLSDMPLSLF